jgi:hypothetical protein
MFPEPRGRGVEDPLADRACLGTPSIRRTQPDALRGIVIDSNLFRPGSTWGIRATAAAGGGTRVEVTAVRKLRGRGWLLWPFFPLGLAKRDVDAYLRQFLAKAEGN